MNIKIPANEHVHVGSKRKQIVSSRIESPAMGRNIKTKYQEVTKRSVDDTAAILSRSAIFGGGNASAYQLIREEKSLYRHHKKSSQLIHSTLHYSSNCESIMGFKGRDRTWDGHATEMLFQLRYYSRCFVLLRTQEQLN